MPQTDDLRDVIRRILPAYARGVAQFVGRSSWNGNYFRGEGHDRPDYSQPMYLTVWKHPEDGRTRYSYQPVLASGRVETRCTVEFQNLRVVAVEDMVIGEPDISPNGDGRRVGLRLRNDSPEEVPISRKTTTETSVETEKTTERGSESSFSKTVEKQFRAAASLSASGGWGGISVEASVETELTQRSEQSRSQTNTWRRSDSRRTSLRRALEQNLSTVIRPYHSFELTAEESVKDIRQTVTVTGRLEADVIVYSWGAQEEAWTEFMPLDELERTLQGLHAETPLASWYANHYGEALTDEELETWERPRVTLVLSINGQRTRLTDMAIVQKPLRDAAGNPMPDDDEVEFEDL